MPFAKGEKKAAQSGSKQKPKSGGAEAAARRKAQKLHPENNLTQYIYRVLKQVHPEVGISKDTMETLNSIVLGLYTKLGKQSSELSKHTGSSTLSAQDVQSAAKLCLPGELQKHGVSELARALGKFEQSRV